MAQPPIARHATTEADSALFRTNGSLCGTARVPASFAENGTGWTRNTHDTPNTSHEAPPFRHGGHEQSIVSFVTNLTIDDSSSYRTVVLA